MKYIKYQGGYKYQLARRYVTKTEIQCDEPVISNFIMLAKNGLLIIDRGYAWDGPSGPTLDTKSFMRGSLIHDALYQLIREGHLPYEKRVDADRMLLRACRADGMWSVFAWPVYWAVRKFGGLHCKKPRRIFTAP